MIVLALDTATSRSSVALGEPGSRPPDAVIASRNDLSRLLGGVVADLCRDRGISPRDIGALLVADGPGSFTGLRIGIAFAKGMHAATGAPVYTAPSLLGAARAACSGAGTVVAEYDALRGDLYRAIYEFRQSAIGNRPSVACLMLPEVMPAEAPPPIQGNFLRADERDASASALLSLFGAEGGPLQLADPGTWEPSYGRLAEAEARRRALESR